MAAARTGAAGLLFRCQPSSASSTVHPSQGLQRAGSASTSAAAAANPNQGLVPELLDAWCARAPERRAEAEARAAVEAERRAEAKGAGSGWVGVLSYPLC